MASPIEKLSEDVLLELFDYLDPKSLKNAVLVCRSWNDVISLSPKILKKFTLKLSTQDDGTFWVYKFDEIMSLRRKFQSITVVLNTDEYTNSVALLKLVISEYGMQIRKLSVTEGLFEKPQDFYQILNQMPLLSELVMKRVKFNWQAEDDLLPIKPVELKYLTKLTVKTSDWYVFEFLMTAPIRILQMTNNFSVVDKPSMVRYLKFLETSDKLESIEFDLAVFSRTFSSHLNCKLADKINFKLKRFKCLLWSPGFGTHDIDSNFVTFLESQASFLKELELNYLRPNVITTIFTKLKVLERLKLNSGSLPNHQEFYSRFKRMDNLKEYISHDSITSEVSVKSILGNCPNIETLDARHDSCQYISNLLPFIAIHNPKLKSLSMENLLIGILPEVKLEQLKYLHIEALTNFEFLIAFLGNNVAIETLSLNFVSENSLQDENIEAVLNHPSLHHLKVAATVEVLRVIANKVRSHYHKLKTLELRLLSESKKVFIEFRNENWILDLLWLSPMVMPSLRFSEFMNE